MNKQERVLAALNGKEVDYIPYSLWYHFGTQFLRAEKAADIEIAFYERYDFDFLKVMNDYSYPLPEGLDRIRTIEDWMQMKPVAVEDYCFSEQLKLLQDCGKTIEREAASCWIPYSSPWGWLAARPKILFLTCCTRI